MASFETGAVTIPSTKPDFTSSTALMMLKYEDLPEFADIRPILNGAGVGMSMITEFLDSPAPVLDRHFKKTRLSPMTTGEQPADMIFDESALAVISGPMPPGSPNVIARRGIDM